MTKFSPIPCGQTLPINNVHAVSVSIPTLQDVIDYEEHVPEVVDKIKSGYPRFILHPYLKILADFIKDKYKVSESYEVVLVSSSDAVAIISDTYFIHNKIDIDEPFGVILVIKGTCQLNKVLQFIQHVGCNLSSRLAEDYLLEHDIIQERHNEELEDEQTSEDILLSALAKAYNQPKENICLSPSGMNSVYAILKGLKNIQARNNRQTIVQLGWLYLDTMNIVKHHFKRSKTFFDITNLDLLEEFLQKEGCSVSAIITEIPTNPLLQCVDLPRLKKLCDTYNIPLVIDSTVATPYNLDLKPYADIFIESLTKYACGNADVLMGCFVLNEDSNISFIKNEFVKHTDKPYIKDIQRLAYEIRNYESRMKLISANTIKLIDYLESCSYVDKVYHCMQEDYAQNYKKLMINEDSYSGLVSVTFNKPFKDIYDKLNFPKGPSLGAEFTLLMPYVYLAHYDYITCTKGREFLEKHGIPIDLLRISVGTEDINGIIEEFKKLETI